MGSGDESLCGKNNGMGMIRLGYNNVARASVKSICDWSSTMWSFSVAANMNAWHRWVFCSRVGVIGLCRFVGQDEELIYIQN